MGYTMAEKILMKNTGLSHLAPGDLIMTRPDMCMVHDIYTPFVVQKLDEMKFRRLADPFIDSAVHCSIDRDLLCANLQPRCEVLGEIPEQLDFFDAMPDYDVSLYANKKQKTTPETAREALEALLPLLSDESLDHPAHVEVGAFPAAIQIPAEDIQVRIGHQAVFIGVLHPPEPEEIQYSEGLELRAPDGLIEAA